MKINFYSADATSFLKFSEVKFRAKKSLSLPENCADYIRFFNYTFNIKFSVYNVLYRKGLGCSRKCATPIVSYVYLIMLIAHASYSRDDEIMITNLEFSCRPSNNTCGVIIYARYNCSIRKKFDETATAKSDAAKEIVEERGETKTTSLLTTASPNNLFGFT
jgi:hypothetical protein